MVLVWGKIQCFKDCHSTKLFDNMETLSSCQDGSEPGGKTTRYLLSLILIRICTWEQNGCYKCALSNVFNKLKPLHNIGKTEKQKCSQIHTYLTWYKDNDERNLSLKYFCLMCYRFRIIREIRSNNEFSSRETKTPAIRMNTKMLNAFFLFSRKRNNEMS